MNSHFSLSPETRRLSIDQPFFLDSGTALPNLTIAYRSWGRLAADGGNAIVVCHALTGSADADAWWPSYFGAGQVLDPAHDFIVCSNVLGGCYRQRLGPTGQAPDGQRWGGRFPALTVRDQCALEMALADALGIRRIRLVLGGSMGGLQALEWALLDRERVQAVASIATSGRHSAWCAVWSRSPAAGAGQRCEIPRRPLPGRRPTACRTGRSARRGHGHLPQPIVAGATFRPAQRRRGIRRTREFAA